MAERLGEWAERFHVAGAAVTWMHGDEVQAAATGLANAATGVEATPDTLFQIGSITKVYTSTLIMQLVEDGKVQLDAPAVTYLPDLRFADAAATPKVTVRHLLTHTSGVDGDFFEDFGRGDDCVAKYVAACSKLEQMFAPGSMWSYCNVGFVVLGRIIEVLTGMSWDVALRKRLLDQIGASRTLTLPEDMLLHRVAAGHDVGLDLNVSLVKKWSIDRSSGPAGATPNSTVGDMLTFARMHIDGGLAADGLRVLPEALIQEMQAPQATLPRHPGDGARQWGLGWMLFDWGGRRIIGHDGGTIGQNSSLRILPEERFAVAMLTNTTPTGSMLCTRVMRWLFGQHMGVEMEPFPKPPETPPAIDLSRYTGTYVKNEALIEITEAEGHLVQQAVNTGPLAASEPPSPAMHLFPVDETVFLQQMPGTGVFQPVSFLQFENGRPAYFFATRLSRRSG